ncbi:hypothetical protein VTO73DRAFT_11496 [Trametes versicolor]
MSGRTATGLTYLSGFGRAGYVPSPLSGPITLRAALLGHSEPSVGTSILELQQQRPETGGTIESTRGQLSGGGAPRCSMSAGVLMLITGILWLRFILARHLENGRAVDSGRDTVEFTHNTPS